MYMNVDVFYIYLFVSMFVDIKIYVANEAHMAQLSSQVK